MFISQLELQDRRHPIAPNGPHTPASDDLMIWTSAIVDSSAL